MHPDPLDTGKRKVIMSHRVQEEVELCCAEDTPHSTFDQNQGEVRLKRALAPLPDQKSSIHSSISVSSSKANKKSLVNQKVKEFDFKTESIIKHREHIRQVLLQTSSTNPK